MCLCILVHQWLDSIPLSTAANREEHYNRPSLYPTWRSDGIFAGSDQRQGGTWQGINNRGLLVAPTNRKSTLQDANRRSRGLLCQDVLQQATARTSLIGCSTISPASPTIPVIYSARMPRKPLPSTTTDTRPACKASAPACICSPMPMSMTRCTHASNTHSRCCKIYPKIGPHSEICWNQ